MDRKRDKDDRQPPACGSAGVDEVCSDEIKHGRQPEDPAMLDGTLLDAGGAIAGLVPLELPEEPERDKQGGGGCDSCR